MTLLAQYEAAIQSGDIVDSKEQRLVVARLDLLAEQLEQGSFFWFKKRVQGLYVFGPVGAGKTYLVDMFYDYVSEPQKARFHFHHFMQQIHVGLTKVQGQKDPLRFIAKNVAKTTRLLCLDEFLVQDVATAMILGELLQALLAEQIVLVISSNTEPDQLYLNGVQRQRFLPAIALLKANCFLLFLDREKDYRLLASALLSGYLYPLNAHTEKTMLHQFKQLTAQCIEDGLISIQNRDIEFVRRGGKTIWFTFDTLCSPPRSQLDYLELADTFDSLFLSNVPLLTENHTMQVILFIFLIDVLYDRGVQVVISAAVPLEALYPKGEMVATFQRTLSRLHEMQTSGYAARHPRRKVFDL